MSYICRHMSGNKKYQSSEAANVLHEAAAIYLRKPGPKKKGSSGDGFDFARFFADKMKLIEAIKAGISFNLYEVFSAYVPLLEADWVQVLGISSKTLQRYKAAGDHIFSPMHSEKIIEMAEVTFMGNEVFGAEDKFRLWLNAPCFALGGYKPKELLISSYGKEMVLGELTRLHYGIFV
jgi:putative toxin-antitoxin system antitoxin component (TIGR02293 family)